MSNEVYHKVDIDNFSELRESIIKVLQWEDTLHIRCLNERLSHLNRGQLMCALDAMERERQVEIRKHKQDIYVSLA